MAEMQDSQSQGIPLDQIEPEQLQQIRKQLDEELELLTNSFATLKQAEVKYRTGMNCLNSLTPASEGKQVLVPLTSSLYVPGKLKDVGTVMVDVGTGYFVEKTKGEAKTFFNTKILDLRKNLDGLQASIEVKQSNRQAISNVLSKKLTEIARAQKLAEGQK